MKQGPDFVSKPQAEMMLQAHLLYTLPYDGITCQRQLIYKLIARRLTNASWACKLLFLWPTPKQKSARVEKSTLCKRNRFCHVVPFQLSGERVASDIKRHITIHRNLKLGLICCDTAPSHCLYYVTDSRRAYSTPDTLVRRRNAKEIHDR